MQEAEPVLLERDGNVAIVRLNRPEKRNAINNALANALARVMAEVDADDSINAIVLTGSGDRAFCAGADMNEAVERLDGAADSPATSAYAAILDARKPVIAAVNGFAYGGGALLMVNTDIRLAAPTATIRFIGATYGLVVAGSELPRIVGPAKAKELLFTARVIDAYEAERIGLVNRVVTEGSVLDAALEMAHQIASNSPAAVQWSKKVVNAATDIGLGRSEEAAANRALRGSQDHDARFRVATSRVVSH